MIYSIDELKSRIEPIARKYRLNAVYLFGSYARGDATEDSDVDILVDREGSLVHGIVMGGLFNDLEACVEKPIDLVTTQTLEQSETQRRVPEFVRTLNAEKVKIYG